MIGISPAGGLLPESWDPFIRESLAAGLNVISGLHDFLGNNREYRELALRRGGTIWDLRRPPEILELPPPDWQKREATIVLTVGTDCNTGKMTAAMELTRAMQAHGCRAAMAPTGQTGIYLTGKGVAVDAVKSDFIAGAAHQVVTEVSTDADIVFVEGQGSLFHPAYSGVTLGLLHGVAPDFLILCHSPNRQTVEHYPHVPIPDLQEVITAYEAAAEIFRPASVIGIALNCCELSDKEARCAVSATAEKTGLPTTDILRFGTEPLVDALFEVQ